MGDMLLAIAMMCAGEVGEWYAGRAYCQQKIMECIEKTGSNPSNMQVFQCIRQYQKEHPKK